MSRSISTRITGFVCHAIAATVGAAVLASSPARGEIPVPSGALEGPTGEADAPSPAASPSDAGEAAALLMDGVSPRGPSGRAVVATLGGYDSAHASAIFQSRAEVRLWGPVTFTGALALASGLDQARLQPRVGLKAQLLAQANHGLDLAVGGGYRRDRYLQDDGMLEAFVALGRSVGELSLRANVLYGSDLEGDDRKGDVRLSAMRAFGRRREWQLGVGLDGELDLASFDARRAARGDSSYEAFAGALAAYSLGPWALLVEGGPVVIKTATTHVGLATMGGLGTAF